MLINKIYSQLHNEGVVENKQSFSKNFMKGDKNTFNYLKHMNRDMSINAQLKVFQQLSKHKPSQAVNECMVLIQQNIKKKYSLYVSPV